MSFGNVPKDAGGIPISSIYVPGTGFIALQGVNPTTDGSSNTSALAGMALYGKNSVAGDTAVATSSSGALKTLGDYTELGSLSAGSLNANLVASTDVSLYKWATLQITGTWTGTITFQGSNDNATWSAVSAFYLHNVYSYSTTTSSNGLYGIPIAFRYLRVQMMAYTSGTATGTLELYTQNAYSYPLPSVGLNSGSSTIGSVNQAGTWLVQGIAGTSGGSTPYHVLSASGTNSTSVKGSAGQLYGLSISNSNAAARFFKLYDKATAPTIGTDTPKRTVQVPANGTVVTAFPVGLNFANGIGFGLTTGIADTDTGSVGTDISVDLDYK